LQDNFLRSFVFKVLTAIVCRVTPSLGRGSSRIEYFLFGDGFYALSGFDFQFFDQAALVVGNAFNAAALQVSGGFLC